MRIAFIINGFPTISETFILDQITWLIERKCEVDIYAQQLNTQGLVHPEVSSHRLIERAFQLSRSARLSRPEHYAHAVGEIIFALGNRPGIVLRVLATSWLSRGRPSLGRFYQILPFLAHRHYDLIHCHFGPNGILATELKRLGLVRAPVITQFHGYDITSHIHEHGQDVYRDLFARGDMFLCVSNQIKERAIQLGCERNKARVHHTGV